MDRGSFSAVKRATGAALVAMLAGLAAKPGAADVPPRVAEEARAAVAVVDRFQAALAAGNLEAAAALLDPEVVILEAGGAEFSREEYFASHAKSDAEFLAAARVEPGRRTARIEGDLAWVASLAQITVQKDARPLVLDGAESMVLRRDASGWKIVHIHWSSRTRK